MDFNSGMCYNPSAEYMEIVGKEEKFMQEQIPVRKVDTGKYMKIIRSLLEEGKEVPLVVTGNSMLPFLVDGRDQVLIKEVNRSLRKGDIAFFQRKNGQYIMHRIRYIRQNPKTGKKEYWFVGDVQVYTEGPIEQEQIFGLIIEAQRKGKRIGEKNIRWLFFRHIWLKIVPFRPLILRLYAFFLH